MGCNRLATGEDARAMESAIATLESAAAKWALDAGFINAEQYKDRIHDAALAKECEQLAKEAYEQTREAYRQELAKKEAEVNANIEALIERQERIEAEATSKEKGIFGEKATYDNMVARGFTPLGGHGNTPQGIDSVWEKNGQYFVLESKYGSSRQGDTLEGLQGSANWVLGRLTAAVGSAELASKIAETGYISSIAKVDRDGNVLMTPLDQHGKPVSGFSVVRPNAPASLFPRMS